MISTDEQFAPLPGLLILSREELETVREALIAFMLHRRKITDDKPERLLTKVDKARGQARVAPLIEQSSTTEAAISSPGPLFNSMSPLYAAATAAPVKPEARLAADAAPQAVTGTAQRRSRSAMESKTKRERKGAKCPAS